MSGGVLNDKLRHDGVEWVEIGKAARLSRTKAVVIREQIAAGTIRQLERDARVYIPVPAMNRLKREAATMIAVGVRNRNDMKPRREKSVTIALRGQDVLPMSSGRGGQGWLGQKPRDGKDG